MPQDVRFDIPFDTPVSEHLEYAQARHMRWVWDMGLVRSKDLFEEYKSWDLPQAAARTYPHASADDMVVLMNWFSLAFLFDDQFDAAQPDRADRIAEVARELIVTPLRPAGSRPRVVCPITLAWAEVWSHLCEGMSLTWQTRFAASWGRFLVARCEEVDLAARGLAATLGLDEYALFRRRTVGIHHSIDAGERSRGFEVPAQAMAHPLMERMRDLAADTIGFMNDILSFEREKRRGDGHNLIAVLHRERRLSWQEAADEAHRMTQDCIEEYLELEAGVPRMCDELRLDEDERDRLRMGVEAIQHWINGNYEWALVTGRYATEKQEVVQPSEVSRFALQGAIAPTRTATDSSADAPFTLGWVSDDPLSLPGGEPPAEHTREGKAVQDPASLAEIELCGELIIAASAAEDRLSMEAIDEVLGVAEERAASGEGPRDVVSGRRPGPGPADAPPRPIVYAHDNAHPPSPPVEVPCTDDGSMEPRSLVAELAEQTSLGREVPLHVQIVRGSERKGVPLRFFALPPEGARVLVTIHAPGLVAVDDLHQELHVMPGRDSDVLRFRLKAPSPGLHQVTVRAFRGGTFLGEVTCQISVGHGSVTRDGPQRSALLPSMAFDPGEVTLQVLKDATGAFSFQLISETFYAPEIFHFRAGDPRQATEQIYVELRRAAKAATTGGGYEDAQRLYDRLRNHGVQLWTSAVPQAVQNQFWEEADHVTAFTVLGEHDIVPWELMYPLNEGRKGRGFLAEWLPVVRRLLGQDRVRSLNLPSVAFVVPPGSPADADEEVRSLRAQLGTGVADVGVLTKRAALTALLEGGHAGVLHFACHNAFTGTGSCVTMADGAFDPIDLASAAQLRSLRAQRPLVFFNACRSAGEIDWFGESLGWAPQFLNAGAGAFVGTLWPVRSRSALKFAEAFYDQLLSHRQPLGQASLAARKAIRDLHGGDPTWLAYAVYGSPAATAHTTA